MLNITEIKGILWDFDDVLCIHPEHKNDRDFTDYMQQCVQGTAWDHCFTNRWANRLIHAALDKKMGLVSFTDMSAVATAKLKWVEDMYGVHMDDFCVGAFDKKELGMQVAVKLWGLEPEEILFVDDDVRHQTAAANMGLQVCSPVELAIYVEQMESANLPAGCEVRGHEIEIKYHASDLEKLCNIEGAKSDWIDLRAAEDVTMHAGDFALISLGVGMKLPDGYEAHMVPRSSTYKTWGILQTNSMGIIDNSYSGDEDVWRFPAYATRDTVIKKGDRICQFRIMERQAPVHFTEVAHLGGTNRGGFGSTGKA